MCLVPLAMGENCYYRCFICQTDQSNVEEFDSHLRCLDHLSNLMSRRMLAVEHFELLLQLNNFSLERVDTSNLENNPSLEKTFFSGLSSGQSSGIFVEEEVPAIGNVFNDRPTFSGDDKFLRSDRRSENSSSFSGPELRGRQANADFQGPLAENGVGADTGQPHKSVVGHFYCNLCSVSLSDWKNVAQHETGTKHRQNKEAYPLKSFPVFKCNVCGMGLDTSQKAMQHYSSSHVATGNNTAKGAKEKKKRSPMTILICQPCGKMGASVGNMRQHFSSDAHKKAVKEKGETQCFIQCRPCKSYFASVAEISAHEKRPEHSTAVLNW